MNCSVTKGVLRLMRIVLCIVFLSAAVFFLAPIFRGILHIGMVWPAAVFLLFAAAVAFPDAVKAAFSGRFRVVFYALAALIGAAVLCAAFTAVAMTKASANAPKNGEKTTVIVLGCQVNGSEPSLMLQRRIDAAYAYLKDNPDALCIASGGRGENEIMSEAACIKSELMRRGIAGSRILTEEKSANTEENLRFSAEILRQVGLGPNVAIASDDFHQLRAGIYAKKQELDPRALACRAAPDVRAGYWAREIPAIFKALLFD